MQAAKPIVKHGYIIRTGRGYSMEELKEAGLDTRVARKKGLPVDAWRQTKHPENVEQLKPIKKAIEERKGETPAKRQEPKKTGKKASKKV